MFGETGCPEMYPEGVVGSVRGVEETDPGVTSVPVGISNVQR